MEFDYPLPGRWRWVSLGELADTKGRAIVSGPFGSNISSRFFVEDGIPVIRGNNLTTGSQKFVDDGFVFVTPEKAKELGNVDAVRDDIIFTAAGSLGQVGIIPERTRFPLYIISNKQMRVRLNRELVDPLFAFQWLSSSAMVEFIQRQNTGSSVPLINLSIVRRLPVPLPPLAEQKAIAAVLGALDDKIELNRRMNATLEAMARALFQSWFVDFDPVRAKLDGRKPAGLDQATAALFSATFQESEIGNIPHAWRASSLGAIITAARERIGRTDAVVLSAVSSSKLVRSDEHFDKQVYSKSISNYLAVRQWDFAYNPSRINIGSVGMLKEDLVGAVSPVYEVFRPTAGFHWFVERFLAQPETKGWIQTLCSGSVRQGLKLKDLASIQCVIPPLPIVHAFNREWERLYSLILANTEQSRTLATLRDTLLPKLLSGELSAAPIE